MKQQYNKIQRKKIKQGRRIASILQEGAGGSRGLTESEMVVSQEMNIPGRQASKFKGPEVGESQACAGVSRSLCGPLVAVLRMLCGAKAGGLIKRLSP